MKLKKFLYSLFIALLTLGVTNPSLIEAKKTNTSSTQSSKSKKSDSKSDSKKSSSKSDSKKSNSKSDSKKNNLKSDDRSRKKNSTPAKSAPAPTVKKAKSNKNGSSYTKPSTPPDNVLNDSLTLLINSKVLEWVPENMNPGGLRVNSVKTDSLSRQTTVSLNDNFTYLPVTNEFIGNLERTIKKNLPEPFDKYSVNLKVNSKLPLSAYINRIDKLPESARKNPPFVKEKNPYIIPDKGLNNDIIALWASHGRYFKPGSSGWYWQRPVLFETLEDTYTRGYVMPFLVPMLENAGAYVFMPQERDTNVHEVIVDNDTNDEGEIYSQPYYREVTGSQKWETGDLEGFIYDLPDFRDTENPFENGTYRQVKTIKSGKPSIAAWCADIPEDGEYAIYVSYKTLPNSTTDAHYTVNYSGGSKEFIVNQTMGGGTWIYLGTFPLEAGFSESDPIITLSNVSAKEGQIVTADAVKIGGGMGNIARSNRRSDIYYDPSTPAPSPEPSDEESDEEDEEDVEQEQTYLPSSQPAKTAPKSQSAPRFYTSGMPRFNEGARYWLHWAGFPESVYSPFHGADDYKDDYTSRGHWVNYLAGGSRVLPNQPGLHIPVDLSFALHTDAGKRNDDSFVGTLGIYYTNSGGRYKDGTPRINSRMLTDLIMRQITNDIRQSYEPRWTRRSMWDKSYLEARVPEVPATLIELMSHQNYADMMYGLDPEFRFSVARSIYKGMARFLSERKDRDLVIQPLPVKNLMIERKKKNHYRLSWEPTPDPLEPSAMPKKYIILERGGENLGFHKVGETTNTHFDMAVSDNEIHSLRVIAANSGGVSFPSETLSFREGTDEGKQLLIVNGFTRISGPEHTADRSTAGFKSENDFGVPYLKDVIFSGHQTNFSRSSGDSHGKGNSDYITKTIAGNSFDYPKVHGEAAYNAGYSFTSASIGAVEAGKVKLNKYKNVDLILGKQKATVIGNGKSGVKYRTIPAYLQTEIKNLLNAGGNLIVTGQYLTEDLYGKYSNNSDRDFAYEVMGVEIVDSLKSKSKSGQFVTISTSDIPALQAKKFSYSNTLNDKNYIVEQPNALHLVPGVQGSVIMQLTDTNAPVGVARKYGKGKMILSSIPLESIPNAEQRQYLMNTFLNYLNK